MKTQITRFITFLFLLLIVGHAGSPFFARTSPSPVASVTETIPEVPHAPAHSSEALGIDVRSLSRIDQIAKEGIRTKAFPGCQVVVMKEGVPVYEKCFGTYTYETARLVKPTTMYDLASLSKTTGTLLAVMKLYDSGKLKLTDKASTFLPFLRSTNKEDITISELLFHESGLPAGLPFYRLVIERKTTRSSSATSDKPARHRRKRKIKFVRSTFQYKESWMSKVPSADFMLQVADSVFLNNRFHDAAMKMIADAHLYGKTYNYSCINFIVLKEIVETISGMSMDAFLDKEFYRPLNIRDIGYLPLRTHAKDEIAPTLKSVLLRDGIVQGYVHDPAAAFLGGVAGNAGLFASARDVATVYQMLLNGGVMDGHRYLSEETCRLFTTTTSASGRRGLGFDKPVPDNPKSNPCCDDAPAEVYGHTGYTGTCCWVDPVNKFVYVFLSNRTYPADGVNKLARMGIRTKIQEIIYQSMK